MAPGHSFASWWGRGELRLRAASRGRDTAGESERRSLLGLYTGPAVALAALMTGSWPGTSQA